MTLEEFSRALAERPASSVYAEVCGDASWGRAMERLVPVHMHWGITVWVATGRESLLGDFLSALLRNDLMGAVGRADIDNQRSLVDWCTFLHNYTPAGCSGSPEAVREWTGLLSREETTCS